MGTPKPDKRMLVRTPSKRYVFNYKKLDEVYNALNRGGYKSEKFWSDKGRFVYAVVRRFEIWKGSKVTNQRKVVQWETYLVDKKTGLIVMYRGCHDKRKDAILDVFRFLHI